MTIVMMMTLLHKDFLEIRSPKEGNLKMNFFFLVDVFVDEEQTARFHFFYLFILVPIFSFIFVDNGEKNLTKMVPYIGGMIKVIH